MAASAQYDLSGKKVWVTGHRGMVGSALVRRLESEDCEILTTTRQEVNLVRQSEVEAWMADHKPEAVFIAAAKVGGIYANDTQPAAFLYENIQIATNVVHSAYQEGVEKLLFLGSSCIYPKFAPQPMPEECLLNGALEPTNEWYAIAKIAGIKACQAYRKQYGCDFISAQPTNLYGVGDNYHPTGSHVVPALIRKAHEAKLSGKKSMEVWGTGKALREFLETDDLADACVFLMKNYSGDIPINVGSGVECSIAELAQTIAKVVGFDGELIFNSDMPDGTPRKLLDTRRLDGMGWKASVPLEEGLQKAYAWFIENSK